MLLAQREVSDTPVLRQTYNARWTGLGHIAGHNGSGHSEGTELGGRAYWSNAEKLVKWFLWNSRKREGYGHAAQRESKSTIGG
ncbi:MAG: hypothetical protein RLZZ282_1168 [Verrucomicrobiota bacterium]|jgi:hypothetical protein